MPFLSSLFFSSSPFHVSLTFFLYCLISCLRLNIVMHPVSCYCFVLRFLQISYSIPPTIHYPPYFFHHLLFISSCHISYIMHITRMSAIASLKLIWIVPLKCILLTCTSGIRIIWYAAYSSGLQSSFTSLFQSRPSLTLFLLKLIIWPQYAY